MNIGSWLKAREEEQVPPQNRLQSLAYKKGYRSGYAFAKAVEAAGIASYGAAFSKWNGRAGRTQYNTLLAIAKFLGAQTVEQVFDP